MDLLKGLVGVCMSVSNAPIEVETPYGESPALCDITVFANRLAREQNMKDVCVGSMSQLIRSGCPAVLFAE